MIIIVFFIIHWYLSLFFQSFFCHRYAAHRMFSMSRGWEKTFFVLNWLANGSSYLSAKAYAVLHRMHHAYADTEKDPHSPKYSKSIFMVMWKAREVYIDIFRERKPIEERFQKNVPEWDSFDYFAESLITRAVWVLVYTGFYIAFASSWWLFLLLPFTIIMGPLHGVIINWFAHKIGYTNFKVNDTSKNLMPVDIFMLGEGFHNNHHKRGSNPNFGYKWFELDPIYPVILILDKLGVIRLNKKKKPEALFSFTLTDSEIRRIAAEFEKLSLSVSTFKKLPEQKIAQCMEAWEAFVEKDWKGDISAYVKDLQSRYEIQLIIDNASESVSQKLKQWVEPIDRTFKLKMHPAEAFVLQKAKPFFDKKYFWQTHSIYQA